MNLTPISDEKKQQIVQRYLIGDGVSQAQLARWYGVHPRTVGRVLRKAGVLETKPKANEEDIELLQVLKEYGITAKDKDKLISILNVYVKMMRDVA